MTSSNGNIFRVNGPLCGEFTGPGEFPAQRPVTRSFDVFFDLRLNKRLSKQSWGWWFETPPWSLWRHCNGLWFKDILQNSSVNKSKKEFPDRSKHPGVLTHSHQMYTFLNTTQLFYARQDDQYLALVKCLLSSKSTDSYRRDQFFPETTIHQYINMRWDWRRCDELTNLPLVSYIYASVNWVRIDSGNGLSPVRRPAITWTSAALLSIGDLGKDFSEIWIGTLSFSFQKMHLKMSSAEMAAILFRIGMS